MSLKEDVQGLESLPLKLMIVAVVASLSIVPAAESLENLRTRDFLNRVELQLENIVSMAQQLAIGGPGGIRTIELDFTSKGKVSFESMALGDRSGGPNMSSVVIRFTNGAVMVKTCSQPQAWMRGEGDHGLIVDSASFDLKMSAHIDGRVEYILVEAV